jgi:hypothetical protein
MTAAPYRAHQTSITTGTGTLTLIAASTAVRSLQAAIGNSSIVTPYMISGGTYFEWGVGTYDGGSPGTLTRGSSAAGSIMASSNAGDTVSLPAGTHDVFIPHSPGMRGTYAFTSTSSTPGLLRMLDFEWVWTGVTADGTVTLNPVANYPIGPALLIRNRGSFYTLTVEADGAETINGRLNVVLLPGQWVEIRRRGSAWDAWGSAPRRTTFTSSGTWTKGALTGVVRADVWAAGGGGGAGIVVAAATACSGGGGGGGGSYATATFQATELAASETITIGAGGTGGTTTGAHGSAGGLSQFGAFRATIAAGGGGGSGGASGANSGGGGGACMFGTGGNATSGTGGTAGGGVAGVGGSGTAGASTAGVGCGSGGSGTTSAAAGNGNSQPVQGGQGGCSGGGITAGNAAQNGGPSAWTGITHSAAGVAPGGSAGVVPARLAGQIVNYGGGGGAAAISVAGGAGAVGQEGGGGGGGGGSTQTGFAAGVGGNGGAGLIIVTEW